MTFSDQYMPIVVVVFTDDIVVLIIVGKFSRVSNVARRPLILYSFGYGIAGHFFLSKQFISHNILFMFLELILKKYLLFIYFIQFELSIFDFKKKDKKGFKV